MKKLLAILVLAMLALTSCNKAAPEATTEAPAADATTTETPATPAE